ncbi:hypothetical protein Pmani_029050 [Petrolisthes manimaculis]|uniref:PHD-type domain-containing protein n=1 Tax=Petrolisthes manimaculis TaxID=1843537 RepID=A0AAE1NYB5_9EUCA|nr:hypothetical protein Pmani_029050 [Petrolisthes manimaculis]
MEDKKGITTRASQKKTSEVVTSQQQQQENAAATETSECGICSKEVLSRHKAVQCETCVQWFHIACEKVPLEVYSYMLDEATGQQQVQWFCGFCKKGCGKIYKRMNKLETVQNETLQQQRDMEKILNNMRELMNMSVDVGKALESRLSELEAKEIVASNEIEKNTVESKNLDGRLGILEAKVIMLSEKMDRTLSLERPTQNQANQSNPSSSNGGDKYSTTANDSGDLSKYFFEEVCEMREKESNMVIYGAPESSSEGYKERIEDDRKVVRSLMEACEVEHNEEEDKLLVFRLGRTKTPNKPRPLLVKQRNSKLKQALFRNIRKLQGKNTFANIRVSNDRTQREKDHDASLWKEAKNMEENGRGKHVVVGPPWHRRIVKSRTTNQATAHQTLQEEQVTAQQAPQEDQVPVTLQSQEEQGTSTQTT